MVQYGLDVIGSYAALFTGRRLGLITSVSGVDRHMRSAVDILHQTYGLTALYGPEHGVRGDKDAGEMVDTYTDPDTGLPVYSLYRKDSKRLTPAMLENIDVMIYDIQDIGTRFYTFLSTLLYAVEDCAANNIPLIVLDRPNPLGGSVVEGNILEDGYKSFVGAYAMPMRHGLTTGEFAQMVNRQQGFGCELTVVPCEGWKRDMLFNETGRLWMMPSLGIPRFETALLYPGHCLIEGTNLSEGRGTSCPFELIGAPFVDSARLCRTMNDKKLPGVVYTPAYFTPTSSKHKGEACGGIHAHVTDGHAFRPVQAGVELLYTLQEMYPAEFTFLAPYTQGGRQFIELLGGSNALLHQPKQALLARYEADSLDFTHKKAQYHLYT